MVKVSNLGYPRLGENREWKKLIEFYWAGDILQGAIIMETQDIIYKKFGACVCKSLTTLPSA